MRVCACVRDSFIRASNDPPSSSRPRACVLALCARTLTVALRPLLSTRFIMNALADASPLCACDRARFVRALTDVPPSSLSLSLPLSLSFSLSVCVCVYVCAYYVRACSLCARAH